MRYIAISVFGDLASYGKYNNRIGVTDGESEHYFYFTVQGKDEDILLVLNVMLNVIYTSAEGKCRKETGTSFAELPLMQRFDAITDTSKTSLRPPYDAFRHPVHAVDLNS